MLVDFYEKFKQHHLLSQVVQIYGPEDQRGPVSYPHIVWMPTQDRWLPPLWKDKTDIIDGVEIEIDSYFTRGAGVILRLFHKDYRSLEKFIEIVVNCIYDVLESTGNFELESGTMINRGQISENTVGYDLSMFVKVPIYKLWNVASVETITEDVQILPRM